MPEAEAAAEDLEADLALIRDAAAEAGRIAMRRFGRPMVVEDKGGGLGPVTEADLEIEAMLRETLMAARPGYGWLSEEAPDDPARLTRERVFIVDPIDGTRAFIDGQKGFGTAIAIAEVGRVVAGVMEMPAAGRSYHARADGGAFCNGTRLAASSRAALEGATALTGSAQLRPELWPGGPPPVLRHFRPALAHRLCLVAAGRFDAFITLRPTWEWDAAAGDIVAREAGAAVTTAAGEPGRYNSPDRSLAGMIAAGPALHDQIVERLRAPV